MLPFLVLFAASISCVFAALPSSFTWTSSAPLIYPKSDGSDIAALKDPSIIYYNGAYHVFASTAVASGYNVRP